MPASSRTKSVAPTVSETPAEKKARLQESIKKAQEEAERVQLDLRNQAEEHAKALAELEEEERFEAEARQKEEEEAVRKKAEHEKERRQKVVAAEAKAAAAAEAKAAATAAAAKKAEAKKKARAQPEEEEAEASASAMDDGGNRDDADEDAEEEEEDEEGQEEEEEEEEDAAKVKKKTSEKKPPQNSKGKARATEQAREEQAKPKDVGNESANKPESAMRSTRAKKNGAKTPTVTNSAGKDTSADVVSGDLYPSCKACVKANVKCEWKTGVIHLRLLGLPNKAKNCENCVRKQIGCHFAWDGDESLKRPAQDAQEAESSKRIKPGPSDIYSCVDRIEKSVDKLVKFAATQAERSAKDHGENLGVYRGIVDSLEALHGKINDS